MKTRIKRICLRILPDSLLLIIKKVHYARTLRRFSENDEMDLKVVMNLVKHRDYVIDVGANIGVYTKFLSEFVGIHGKVFCIEPIPQTFKILCSNVKKLGLRNVIPMNYAISEKNGIVAMQIPPYDTGGKNYYQARIIAQENGTNDSCDYLRVESKTIDSLFSEFSQNISFIKCDIEGHELSCIRGAVGIIKKSKPAWLIEMSGNPDELNSAAHESFRRLFDEGYGAYWFDGRKLRKRNPGDTSVNYFFLMPKHLEILREYNFIF